MTILISCGARLAPFDEKDQVLAEMAKGTSMMEKGYKGVFESLPKEEQSKLIGRKTDFTRLAEICL